MRMRSRVFGIVALLIVIAVGAWHYGDASARALGLALANRAGEGVAPERDTPRTRIRTVRFEYRANSGIYRINAHDEEEANEMAYFVGIMDEFTRGWLGAPPARWTHRPVQVYLCSSLDEMRSIIRALCWPEDAPRYALRPVSGRYISKYPAIFAIGKAWRLRRTLAHEVVHHVMHEHAPACPIVLDEGAAGYIAEWYSGVGSSSERLSREAARLRNIGYQPFEPLLHYDWTDFHGVNESHHYTLARLFIATLADSRDPAIRGRLRELFAQYDTPAEPWNTFWSIYDPKRIERAWRERVAGFVEDY